MPRSLRRDRMFRITADRTDRGTRPNVSEEAVAIIDSEPAWKSWRLHTLEVRMEHAQRRRIQQAVSR